MNRRTLYILGAMVLLFAAGAAAYSILRHMDRQSTTLDLAIQDQVVWNTSQGRPFASSIEVRNYLADHLSLILALLAPFYWIWPDVRLLLAFQAVALALGAYPVFRLTREETGDERLGLLLALVYLLYPALGFMARFDFHAEALVTPLLLAALWQWRARRTGLASLFLVLALLCREETGLVIAGLGLVWALREKGPERRLAGQWAIIGLAWSLLGMGLVMPHLRGGPSDTFQACFQHLGPSYGGALLGLLRDPWGAVAGSWAGLVGYKATFLPRLLLPLAFLPLLAPLLLLPMLPAVAPAFFSRCLPHSTIYYQYTAPLIPFLFWAAAVGCHRAEGWLVRLLQKGGAGGARQAPSPGEPAGPAAGARHAPPRQKPGGAPTAGRVILALLLLLGTAGALLWDFPWWKPVEGPGLYAVGRPGAPPNQAAFREAAALIPPDAALAAGSTLAPHFAHRQEIYLFPYWESWRAEYILLDLAAGPPAAAADYDRLLQVLGRPREGVDPLFGTDYGVRYWRDGILLLQRGYAADPAVQEKVVREVERLMRAPGPK